MADYDNQLLRQGIIHAKAKEFDSARRFFERALMMADDFDTRERAHFYLSEISEDPIEKRKHLDSTLAINPQHAAAVRALAILDGKLKAEEIVDADKLPAQSTETQTVKADRFACPKCGSRMVFDGDGVSLVCESCTSKESLNANSNNEQNFVIAMATGIGQRAPVAMKTFKCQGCGAEFLLPPQVISENCAYCGATYVLSGTRELLEPDSIVPMAFNQRQAAKHLVDWVQRHKIKPQGKVQAPRGLYLPIWTFDLLATMKWRGVIYQDNRNVPVSGEEMATTDDLPIYSTPKLSDILPKIMQTFNTNDCVAYDARYLAGWPAEIYKKTLAEASLDARQKIVDQLRQDVASQNSSVSELTHTSNISILSFKLVMIPLWVTEYQLEDQRYRVIINGQTGSMYGERASRGVMGWLGNLLKGEE